MYLSGDLKTDFIYLKIGNLHFLYLNYKSNFQNDNFSSKFLSQCQLLPLIPLLPFQQQQQLHLVTQQHQSQTVDNNFTNNTYNSFVSCIGIIFVVCFMSLILFSRKFIWKFTQSGK